MRWPNFRHVLRGMGSILNIFPIRFWPVSLATSHDFDMSAPVTRYSVKVDIGDIFQAFIDGCREARANPTATDDDFKRGGDAYVKLLIERASGSKS